MERTTQQYGGLQVAEAPKKIACKSAAQRHIMPGLIADLVRKFTTRGRHYTTRAVQQDEHVRAEIVNSALFHNLFLRVEALERMLAHGGSSPSGATSLYVVDRRKAA